MACGNFQGASAALILLSGLPGAGKTTFAGALATRVAFDHVESDAIRRGLSAQPIYSPRENSAVFAIADSLAREALKSGRHAVVDATNLTVKDRQRFFDIGRDLAVRVLPVRLVAPDESIRDRLSAPREGHSQAGLAVYERVKARPELIAAPTIVVDSRFPLAPAVELVASLLCDGQQ